MTTPICILYAMYVHRYKGLLTYKFQQFENSIQERSYYITDRMDSHGHTGVGIIL